MQEHTYGSSAPENAKKEAVLGRCLVEGDPETTASARSRRRKTFGVSLGIEVLLLGVLVVVPLLTTIAQPQLRRDVPGDVTFISGGHRPTIRPTVRQTIREHAATPVWSYTQLFSNSQRPVRQATEESGAEDRLDIPGGLEVPGVSKCQK